MNSINVGQILSNTASQNYNPKIDCTKHILLRIQKLGLNHITDNEGYRSDGKFDWEVRKGIEQQLQTRSATIQWKLTPFTKQDVENAAEYLELFLLFTAQDILLTDEGIKQRGDQEKCQTRIRKAIKLLEDICTDTQSTKKILKESLPTKAKELNHKLNKILNQNVSISHRLLYSHDIKRALKILINYK